MAFNIAYTYQLIDKYSGPLSKIIAATKHHTRFLEENQKAMRGLSPAWLTALIALAVR